MKKQDGSNATHLEFVKYLLLAYVVSFLSLALPALARDANEKLTALPLHGGLTFQQEGIRPSATYQPR